MAFVIGFGVAAIVCISSLAVLIIRYHQTGGGEVEHEGNRAYDHRWDQRNLS